MPHADENEASPSLTGLRTAKLSPRSWASGRSSGVTPYADQNESSLSLGCCELRNCRRTQIRMRRRRPWGLPLRNCRQFRRLLGGPAGGMVPHANQNEASPSLGGANCEADVTFVGFWEVQRSDVTRTSE